MNEVEFFEIKLNDHEETDELITNAVPARRMFKTRPTQNENNPHEGKDMRMIKKLAQYIEQGIDLQSGKNG